MATDLFACSKRGGAVALRHTHRAERRRNIGRTPYRAPTTPTTAARAAGVYANGSGLGETHSSVDTRGTVPPRENHLFLLEVFSEIRRRRPDARLLLVGDGALRPQIERRIAELELADAVILTGVVSDVHRYMQAMDVFVFPSHYEGLGMV